MTFPNASNERDDAPADTCDLLSPMGRAALEWARAGWLVLPLDGKVPRTEHGALDATRDEQQIRAWWTRWPEANVGGRRDDCVVVDVDPRNGGWSSFDALEQNGNTFPETREHDSGGCGDDGSFGRHLIYATDTPTADGKLAPGIDIKGSGYVVLPPSQHESGHAYEVAVDREPAPLPAWIALQLQAKRTNDGCFAPTPIDIETDEGRRRVRLGQEDARTMPPSRGDGEGGKRLLNLCLRLVRRYELPLETAYEIVEQEFNPRCTRPDGTAWPWSDKDIWHKLKEARDKSSMPCGILSEATEKGIDALKERMSTPPMRRGSNEAEASPAPHGYECVYGVTALPNATEKIDQANAALVLSGQNDAKWKDVLRYDILRERVTATRPPIRLLHAEDGRDLSETDAEHISFWFRATGKSISADAAYKVARTVAQRRPFNPIVEYLESLPPATGAIDELADLLGAKTELERAYMRKTLLAAVRRAVRPGCKVDTVLVLRGPPAKKKSALVEAMFGDEWVSENLVALEKMKENGEIMAGKWAVLWDEMAGAFATRDGRNVAMSFITRRVDTFRAAYARGNATPHPRCGVLIGTINSDEIYRDLDGADVRRLWVLEVTTKVDTSAIRAIRDAFWSEAFAATKGDVWEGPELVEGEPHWLSDDETTQHEERAKEFAEPSPYKDDVAAFIRGKTEVTTSEVAMCVARNDRSLAAKLTTPVSKALRQIGCIAKRTNARRYWTVPDETVHEETATKVTPAAVVVPLRSRGR